jgi:creatinine amidohydrolase
MTRLLDLPHTRARALLASGAPVYLPVNPVEYHGPHLSLHNDSLISEGFARDIHAALTEQGRDWPFLLATDLEVGVDPTPGPGTRATSYRDVSMLVVDACRRLAELGARNVVLVTFHGSPLHSLALDAGVRWLRRNGVRALSPLNLLLRALLDIRGEDYSEAYATIVDDEERAAMMREAPSDFHAGFFETSVALHYAPDSVDEMYTRLPPCPTIVPDATLLAASRTAARFGRESLARELHFAAVGVGWHALRPFPAYTSRPHRASAEAGATITRHVVREFAAVTSRVLDGLEAPPAPIMQWLAPATFGGSFAPSAVPLNAIASFDALRALPQSIDGQPQ